MALSSSLVKSTVVAALGGLLFGFDTAVISGATAALKVTFALSDNALGITVASALLGTVFGAMLAGIPGDRYGRRDSLRVLGILYVISAIGSAFAWDWYSLLVFRVIGGLGIGGSSVLGPMYIAEIAPARWRGRLVGAFQLNVVGGILLAYFSNYLVTLFVPGTENWRWKLGVSAIPAIGFFVLLFAIPRSPRWLVQKGRGAEARAVLVEIGEEDIDQEMEDMQRAAHFEASAKDERLFQRRYALPIFLAVSIAAFNQLSGINAILYYLNDIFARAGFSSVSQNLQAVAIGATNLLFTMLAMTMIDRAGRKTLLLIGAVGTAVCLGGVAWIFAINSHEALLLPLLVGFIACFAFSQGAVIWVYISEVFPNRVRAKGQSLGCFTHWFMNAVISWQFPVIAARSKAGPFVFFAAMMAVQFFVVLFVYPETKGQTLESMDARMVTN